MNLLLLLLFALCSVSLTDARYTIGVNYGQLGNNLPSPKKAVELIQQLKIGKVKIYDANPEILTALANTSLRLMIMVPNQQITSLAASQRSADQWVKQNVSSYYPSTRISMVLVGNEILADFSLQQSTWPQLVPAMKNIYTALKKYRLHNKIKVSTPHALTILPNSDVFPPSNGTFRSDISSSVIEPMLKFLQRTRSPFCIDAYPFFTWEFNRETVPLELALFNGSYTDPGSGLHYDNLLDIQLDAVAWAFRKLGPAYDNVDILLTETGWPTKGGIDERGANVYNAATYNRRLARRVLKKPAIGTPLRSCRPISTYIFALFNENLKPGPVTERNWGLLTIVSNNGTVAPSYDIDLQGRLDDQDYKPLPKPPPEPLPGSMKLWCIANTNASTNQLQDALSYACGQPGVNCTAIQAGQTCFLPDTLLSHASYAFNDYYFNQKVNGGSCVFNGAANLTTADPSYGGCKYNPVII